MSRVPKVQKVPKVPKVPKCIKGTARLYGTCGAFNGCGTFNLMLRIAAIAVAVIIFGLILFDVGFITSRYIKPNLPFMSQSQKLGSGQAVISGTIHLNGPIPQGSSISIGIRDHGTTGDYQIFTSGLTATDDSAWQYNQAEEGKSYQLQAYLDLNGTHNATSEPITVSAPATEEVLTINIVTPPSSSPQPATISGTLYVNGYIPQGAVVDVLGRNYGSTNDFTVIVDNLSAQVKRTITYSNAVAGQKYEVKGQLIDSSGAIIGDSSVMIISAPSDNAVMTINSSAQPPAGSITPIGSTTPSGGPTASTAPATGSSAISGTINFNGSAPGGTSIVILAKQPSDTQYQVVVNGVTPANGATWTWNGANAGTTYNMVAVLKGQQNNQNIDYADSQTYTVAAPAQNQLFTLNTGISMGAPSGSVWITCGTKNNSNVWSGNTVNFTSVNGGQYYSFQVGSTSGGYDIANIQQAAQSTTNQTIGVSNLNDSVIYYAQYAVSSVTNPTPAQLSPYSGVYTLKCPN